MYCSSAVLSLGKQDRREQVISWLEKWLYKQHIHQTGSSITTSTECSSDDKVLSGKVKFMVINRDEIFLKVELFSLNFLIYILSFPSNLIPPDCYLNEPSRSSKEGSLTVIENYFSVGQNLRRLHSHSSVLATSYFSVSLYG